MIINPSTSPPEPGQEEDMGLNILTNGNVQLVFPRPLKWIELSPSQIAHLRKSLKQALRVARNLHTPGGDRHLRGPGDSDSPEDQGFPASPKQPVPNLDPVQSDPPAEIDPTIGGEVEALRSSGGGNGKMTTSSRSERRRKMGFMSFVEWGEANARAREGGNGRAARAEDGRAPRN